MRGFGSLLTALFLLKKKVSTLLGLKLLVPAAVAHYHRRVTVYVSITAIEFSNKPHLRALIRQF